MEASTSGLSKKLAQCKKDMDLGLVQVRALVQETQKQLQQRLWRSLTHEFEHAWEMG